MTVAQSKALSVAVLIRAPYYAYGLSYPSVLYYNTALATLQALQYDGIPAEIVTDAITQAELNEYGGLRTVRGDGNDVRSDITLTVPWYVRVVEYDRVTLPDGSKRPVKMMEGLNC